MSNWQDEDCLTNENEWNGRQDLTKEMSFNSLVSAVPLEPNGDRVTQSSNVVPISPNSTPAFSQNESLSPDLSVIEDEHYEYILENLRNPNSPPTYKLPIDEMCTMPIKQTSNVYSYVGYSTHMLKSKENGQSHLVISLDQLDEGAYTVEVEESIQRTKKLRIQTNDRITESDWCLQKMTDPFGEKIYVHAKRNLPFGKYYLDLLQPVDIPIEPAIDEQTKIFVQDNQHAPSTRSHNEVQKRPAETDAGTSTKKSRYTEMVTFKSQVQELTASLCADPKEFLGRLKHLKNILGDLEKLNETLNKPSANSNCNPGQSCSQIKDNIQRPKLPAKTLEEMLKLEKYLQHKDKYQERKSWLIDQLSRNKKKDHLAATGHILNEVLCTTNVRTQFNWEAQRKDTTKKGFNKECPKIVEILLEAIPAAVKYPELTLEVVKEGIQVKLKASPTEKKSKLAIN